MFYLTGDARCVPFRHAGAQAQAPRPHATGTPTWMFLPPTPPYHSSLLGPAFLLLSSIRSILLCSIDRSCASFVGSSPHSLPLLISLISWRDLHSASFTTPVHSIPRRNLAMPWQASQARKDASTSKRNGRSIATANRHMHKKPLPQHHRRLLSASFDRHGRRTFPLVEQALNEGQQSSNCPAPHHLLPRHLRQSLAQRARQFRDGPVLAAPSDFFVLLRAWLQASRPSQRSQPDRTRCEDTLQQTLRRPASQQALLVRAMNSRVVSWSSARSIE